TLVWPLYARFATSALAAPTRDPELLPWQYVGLARVAKGRGDMDAARTSVAEAISADAAAGGHTGAAEAARALLE
ncbi:MAG TPA: hypothetical protein VFZ98_13650, partial [Vicinamibacterales bacterium]